MLLSNNYKEKQTKSPCVTVNPCNCKARKMKEFAINRPKMISGRILRREASSTHYPVKYMTMI